MKRLWVRRVGAAALGAAAGYLYYAFIGCSTGTCPITSNPWISTGYGCLVGLLAAGAFTARPDAG
jgi:hypothetical protein